MTRPTGTHTGATTRPAPTRRPTHDGLTLAYDDLGKRDGEPIMFLHGATDCRLTWERVTPAVGGTHRLVMLDARGHGDSDADPNGYDRLDSFAGDVIALCEQEVDQPSVLVGASHGGVIAAAVAARRPDLVSALLLLDPPLFGGLPPQLVEVVDMLDGLLATVASHADRESSLRTALLRAPAFGGEGTLVEVLGEDGVGRLAYAWSRVDPGFLTMMRDAAAAEEPFGLDGKIRQPVLVIRADPAKWMPCFRVEHEDRLRRLAPEARFVAASGAGHMLHAEQPRSVADQLVAFLASRDVRPSPGTSSAGPATVDRA